MTTNMSSRSAWADLPPEIVDKILGYCHKRLFLVLSQVNHQLNSLTLSRYFAPQIIGDLIQLPSRFSSERLSLDLGKDPPPIRILQTAFWLPRTVQHIDYRPPSHTKCGRYINDLHVLTTFIHKMPKLISLRIDSGQLFWTKILAPEEYHAIWNELLTAAISKGCRILEIKEKGVYFKNIYQPFKPRKRLSPLILRVGPHMFRLLNQALVPKADTTSLSPSSLPLPDYQIAGRVQPSLQELQIDGGHFENWPVFPTILMLPAASLTRLSLTNMCIYVPRDIETMFSHVHFIALRSFTFSTSYKWISPAKFLKFLSRHPALIDLDLDARFITPPKWPLWWNPPVFPNLQHLAMFPKTVAWLVPDFRRCPKLHSISLKGNDDFRCTNTRNSQNVIRSILNNLHGFPSMMWPLKVEITVPSDSWISMCHTTKDGETQPRSLRVKALRLNNLYIGLEYSPHPHIDILINWLSTFPSLEYLEIDSGTYTLEKEFVKMVAARCPKLRSFGHHGKFCGNLGREWKMWDVQNGRIESYIIRYPEQS